MLLVLYGKTYLGTYIFKMAILFNSLLLSYIMMYYGEAINWETHLYKQVVSKSSI